MLKKVYLRQMYLSFILSAAISKPSAAKGPALMDARKRPTVIPDVRTLLITALPGRLRQVDSLQ